jgi:hypothetical protein
MPRELPTEPGLYYWSEWDSEVSVYRVGGSLWVNMSCFGFCNVKVTNNIAGTFKRVEDGKAN